MAKVISIVTLYTKERKQPEPSLFYLPKLERSLTEQLVQHLVERVGLGYRHEVARVLLDLSQISDQIGVVRLNSLGLLDRLPTKEDDGKEEHHHVARSVVSEGRWDKNRQAYENRKLGISQLPGRNTV
jgi:hypothetical protein